MDSFSKNKNATVLEESSSSSDDNGGFSYKGFKFRPKKKRRNDAGRRCQKGVTYDSSLGITCHFCRQKTTRKHVYCRKCVLALCGPCLQNRHGENIEIEVADDNWLCPMCRGGCGRGCKNCCNCTFCRKKQGLKPPKFPPGELRAHGFDNVHDYLIHLETAESATVISARKLGKGWCSSSEKTASMYKKDVNADSHEKSRRNSDGSAMARNGSISEDASSDWEMPAKKSNDKRFAGAVKTERPEPSKDTHGSGKNEKGSMTRADTEATHSTPISQISQGAKADLLFPEQFRSKNEFRKKLEIKLAQPFDPQELKELWVAITCRKAVSKVIDTDVGMSSLAFQERGHSYIEHHPDLAQKYLGTGERELKLRLLRGFFFWLEHGSMAGSFKPWTDDVKDDDCLELNGPDCEVLGVLLNVDKEQPKPGALPDEGGEDDIKPKISDIFVNSLLPNVKIQSNFIFNWDKEDIKPTVGNLPDWQGSAEKQAGKP